MASEFITVAQLRAEMAKVLSDLGRSGEPVYLTQRGRPRAVLLDVEHYRSLVEQLEHLDDSIEALLARQRREAGTEKVRPLEEVVRRRRRSAMTRKAAKRSSASVSR